MIDALLAFLMTPPAMLKPAPIIVEARARRRQHRRYRRRVVMPPNIPEPPAKAVRTLHIVPGENGRWYVVPRWGIDDFYDAIPPFNKGETP